MRSVARWIHRTLVRVRARTTGSLLWPAGRVEVEGPDGSLQEIRLDALSLERAGKVPQQRIEEDVPRGAAAPGVEQDLGLRAHDENAIVGLAGRAQVARDARLAVNKVSSLLKRLESRGSVCVEPLASSISICSPTA